MLRDARIAQLEHGRELPDRTFLPPNEPEDLLAARLGNKLKRIHKLILATSEMYGTFPPPLK
jgi:hypothetical protein